MKKKTISPTIALNTLISGPLTSEHASDCARAVISHILYLRAQLPQMLTSLQDERSNENAGPHLRKSAAKALANVELLMSVVTAQVMALPSLSLVIAIGSSCSRPREAFELQLQTSYRDEDLSSRAGRGEDVAQRICRTLVASLSTGAPPAPRLSRIFLLLHCKELSEIPSGFTLRRSLRPDFEKAKLRATLRANQASMPADESQPSFTSSTVFNRGSAAAVPDGLWLVSRVSCRGMLKSSLKAHDAHPPRAGHP
jgi:hypothetical protein